MELKEDCCICHVPMNRITVAVIKVLPCNHIIHQKCAEPILQNDEEAFCPICHVVIVDSEVVQRKSYKKNTTQDKERVVACANRGEDWATLAQTLGVKYKTAYHWVRSGDDEMKKRGGIKPKFLSQDDIDIVIAWVEAECDLTLKQIQIKIHQIIHKNVSVSCIANYMEGQLLSYKMAHKESVAMNSLQNKDKRAAYVRTLNEFVQQGKQIVWIDETNFNLFCRRRHGRARVGYRAIQKLPASRGTNIHLIGAISSAGVLAFQRRRGSYTAALANAWMQALLQNWENLGNNLEDLVVVADNAPCHASLNTIFDNNAATLLKLGPYSPMLNPIEIIWSKVKQHAKTHMRVPDVVAPGLMEQRLQYLEDAIDSAKDSITGGDCARAVQHSSTFHHAALMLNDMRVGS